MATSTVPEFRPVFEDVPRLEVRAGTTLQLLVVAADDRHCAGVDLDSGVLVRGWSPSAGEARIRPYDVVAVTIAGGADGDAVPDPSQPEAVTLAGPPQPAGRLNGRRAERLLRPLLHPGSEPLLGVPATAIPFWERRADHPSIAVVEPPGQVGLFRDGSYLACRFTWQGHVRELPCLDRSVAGLMDRAGRRVMTAPKGCRLVVALTAPVDGRCHKVVETVLSRP